MDLIIVAFLAISCCLNIWQYLSKKKQKKSLAMDARQIIHDLTRGGSIVKITVIDPEGLMIYKPQGS